MILIKIILISWAITWIITSLEKKKETMFCCGLTAYSGPVPADRAKLALIACLNESRGEHSCGIFSGGVVIYGAPENKMEKISVLLRNTDLPLHKDWRTVMMHTRHATLGKKSLENCHPFVAKKGRVTQFFCHNGTIKYPYTLGQKFGFNWNEYDVDSKMLGDIILNDGYEVLSKYEGAASLIWNRSDEKNTLYLFRGAAGGKEERPLYYWTDSETGGTYFSSMVEPLFILSKSKNNKESKFKDDVFIVNPNAVYKCVSGKMILEKEVTREENLHENFIIPTTITYPQENILSRSSRVGEFPESGGMTQKHIGQGFVVPMINTFRDLTPEGEKIFYANKASGGYVFWKQGRYFIQETKIYGEKILDSEGKICAMKNNDNDYYYFFDGILLKNKKSYERVCNSLNLFKLVSRFTLAEECAFPFCCSFYKEEKRFFSNYLEEGKPSNYFYGNTLSQMIVPFDKTIGLIFDGHILKEVYSADEESIIEKENEKKNEKKEIFTEEEGEGDFFEDIMTIEDDIDLVFEEFKERVVELTLELEEFTNYYGQDCFDSKKIQLLGAMFNAIKYIEDNIENNEEGNNNTREGNS